MEKEETSSAECLWLANRNPLMHQIVRRRGPFRRGLVSASVALPANDSVGGLGPGLTSVASGIRNKTSPVLRGRGGGGGAADAPQALLKTEPLEARLRRALSGGTRRSEGEVSPAG